MSNRHRLEWGLLLLALVLAGCEGGGRGKKGYLLNRPEWDYEQYSRIAVLPGRASVPQAAHDADVLSDRLLTLLAQNGGFKVLSRTEMKAVFAEQDLSKLSDAIDEGTALPEHKIEVAQALVATRITDYKLIAEREQQRIPRYAVDRHGNRLVDRYGRPIVAGEEVVTVYRHGAEVEGSVRVIDAATNRVLISHTARIVPRPHVSRNQPPSQTPEQIASDAVRELSVEFYKTIAPTEVRVKFKGDMLIVAKDYYDGHYTEAKRLPRDAEEFIVAVRYLPEEADRNNFRLVITEEQGRDNLFEQAFTWSGSSGPEGISYKVPTSVLTGTGGEQFVAKLYCAGDPEPKLVRKFALESVKSAKN